MRYYHIFGSFPLCMHIFRRSNPHTLSLLSSSRTYCMNTHPKMPPKRKANTLIPSNAASAANYTDKAGDAPNKRSRIARHLPNAFELISPKPKPTAKVAENGAPGEAVEKGEVDFDHSRPEEKAGIVDRRYYPAEMSNARCAMYNVNEIPRPIEVLEKALHDTEAARSTIRSGHSGDAVVHWFKRDLRVRDNTGLSKASELAREKGVGVIGVWIMSPQDWEAHLVSPPKCDFEIRSVGLLKAELAELDIPLHVEVVPNRKNVPGRLVDLCKEWDVKNITCNLEYEPDELRREAKLVGKMAGEGISFEPWHDDCVVPPGALRTGNGKQYAVYSPWYRAWVAFLHANPHVLDERPMPSSNTPEFTEKFKALFEYEVPALPASKSLSEEEKERFRQMWPAGEAAALDRLERFLTEKVDKYKETRNFPALNSTGRVSVHHAAGTLAARTSVRMARDVNSTKKLDGGKEGVKGWIGEVAWRDFYSELSTMYELHVRHTLTSYTRLRTCACALALCVVCIIQSRFQERT
jgi:deoxyribodipyrimidine photo-lyase